MTAMAATSWVPTSKAMRNALTGCQHKARVPANPARVSVIPGTRKSQRGE